MQQAWLKIKAQEKKYTYVIIMFASFLSVGICVYLSQ